MSKYFFSICAIVRNEADYLSEWLEFHRLQGVDHFYLYLNSPIGDDIATKDVVVRESTKGDITFELWPGVKQQCIAYDHCLKTFGDESEWMAFIDVDEFLWPKDRSVYNTVAEHLLYEYTSDEDVGAIAVHWVLFGSNNYKERTDGLVIERFTKRAESVNHHVKSIVRPLGVKSAGKNPHAFYLEPGFTAINERGHPLPVEYALIEEVTADTLRINHYHVKSLSEYRDRKSNPDPNSARTFTPEEIDIKFIAHDGNDYEDIEVRDLYAEKIRAKL